MTSYPTSMMDLSNKVNRRLSVASTAVLFSIGQREVNRKRKGQIAIYRNIETTAEPTLGPITKSHEAREKSHLRHPAAIMTVPLVSAAQIARDAHLPAPSTIKVKNLYATIQGPQDAWGRPDRPQPIAITAAVSLDAPFNASSANDTVAADTVHYGLLSKAILSILAAAAPVKSLRHLLDKTWAQMTGADSRGQDAEVDESSLSQGQESQQQQPPLPPFLYFAQLRALEISLHLPKATLLGDGVSLTVTGGFELVTADGGGGGRVRPVMRQGAVSLKIHRLRVPTLIGVNSNERLAKQVVIASVEIDRLEDDADVYPELEQVVVTVMLESSYETLEALGTQMTVVIAAHLQRKHTPPRDGAGWNINLSLEKPIAVPLADAACVEMSTNTVNVPI
ncbi:hypothetical protein G3M48_004956 [Beauveria asiatica]|uniref:Dihydroneopterin aldolase/epimerase domain-containing protein n=1 Tax=Beauveria asiatica TaxID=1069075 RepID=A0AAW0RSX5_9HYPO